MGVKNAGVCTSDGIGDTLLEFLDLQPRVEESAFQTRDFGVGLLELDFVMGNRLVLRALEPDSALGDSGRNRNALEPSFSEVKRLAHGMGQRETPLVFFELAVEQLLDFVHGGSFVFAFAGDFQTRTQTGCEHH